MGDDGFPQGPWTPELLADAISKIDSNRSGVDLRTVQLWFQENDKGISTTNIRWLARIFGCGDKEATNDWMKELSAAQARLTAKRRDTRKTGGAATSRVPDMPAPAANQIPLTPVVSVDLEPMSTERPSGLAIRTETIFSHGSHLNLPSSVFAGSSALGSTIDRDLDIKVTPFDSTNEKAPTHRVYAKSPRGYDIEVGGIWKKTSGEGKPYYTLSIKRLGFNANLGRYPGQDDLALQAIIEWEPRD
ncbi:uncharacterized protein (DUF736 family) [Shinella granuli]|uniref:Uncharacterized protein (DUF736 family) n=1 Tax=Shinella granuli TaxID=323621 RepID=A0A4R2C5A1_SHIGR|nr:uncharacterized protein (DUF736 family) [Shinella granuli]